MSDGAKEVNIDSAMDSVHRGRPDAAAMVLSQMIKAHDDLDAATPLLAKILRDNARDAQLLRRLRFALCLEETQCGSHDHLDYGFRRQICGEHILQEVGALAYSRTEASIYSLIIADDLISAGQIDAAEKVLKSLLPPGHQISDNHDDVRAALEARKLGLYVGIWDYLRGRIALERGDLQEAIDAFESAVERDPKLYCARVYAGQVCRRLGLGAKACGYFDLKLPLGSEDTDIYTGW